MAFTMDPNPMWEFGPYAQACLGVGWGLYWTFVALDVWEWLSIILVLVLQSGWHVMTGFIAVDNTPGWTVGYLFGSNGFNYPRYIYGVGGVVLAFLIDLMHWPHTRPLSGYAKDPCGDLDLDDESYKNCVELLEDEKIWYFDEETEMAMEM